MTKFEKWAAKNEQKIYDSNPLLISMISWNTACQTILNTIKRRHKEFEGNWQHEDIEILIQEIEETTR